MALGDIDMLAVLRSLAERQIEDAIEEGKFDNLAGQGKPLNLEPMPADEEARAMYWALRIMKNADALPDEVTMRRAASELRVKIEKSTDPAVRKRLVEQHNEIVHRLNTLGTNAIKVPMDKIEVEP